VDTRLPRHAALAGEQRAVHGNRVQARSCTANRETDDVVFVAETPGHPGQAERHFARRHVGEVAERIHRRDVLEVGGIALRGDCGCGAFAFAGDREGLHTIDPGGKIEITSHTGAGCDGHRVSLLVEAEVGRGQFMRAGGHLCDYETSRQVGRGTQAQRADLDTRALE
jgi:hypothetical protein